MDVDVDALVPGTPGQIQKVNSSIEEIFLFTLNKYSVVGGKFSELIFLNGLAEVVGNFLFFFRHILC